MSQKLKPARSSNKFIGEDRTASGFLLLEGPARPDSASREIDPTGPPLKSKSIKDAVCCGGTEADEAEGDLTDLESACDDDLDGRRLLII